MHEKRTALQQKLPVFTAMNVQEVEIKITKTTATKFETHYKNSQTSTVYAPDRPLVVLTGHGVHCKP
jgi:hypothetical protein